MSGASDAQHGLMPMQAVGASNRPISLQPFGQRPLGDREHVLRAVLSDVIVSLREHVMALRSQQRKAKEAKAMPVDS